MMTRSHLGACLGFALAALSAPALAAQPGCVAAPEPAALQIQADQAIASENAMFREMTAEMNAVQAQMAALFSAVPFPTPQQMLPAMFGPGLSVMIGPGSGAVISISSSGSGTCSETITYSYPANGGRPIIHVAQRGNACGAIHLNGSGLVPAAEPGHPHVTPPVIQPTHGPQLIEAEYRRPTPRG